MSNVSPEKSEAIPPGWKLLVAGIQNNDPAALEKFYEIFAPSIKFFAIRKLQDEDAAADCSSQCLVLALEGIREGRLREPAAIAGYVWGILRNLLRQAISSRMDDRGRQADQVIESLPSCAISPENNAILRQQQRDVRKALGAMRPIAREVLRRFYLEGAAPSEIQRDLGITPTQFRLIKNRAKATLIQKVGRLASPGARGPVAGKPLTSLITDEVKPSGTAISARPNEDATSVTTKLPHVLKAVWLAACQILL